MRNKLASSLTGAVFSLAASGLALAADIAVKGPPPAPPAPVYNWTGFYVGGNAGVSLGTFKTDFNAPTTVAATVSAPGLISASGASTFGFGGTDTLYPGGFIGGGQIGFNWQFSPLWVVGVEADFQGADEKEHGGPFTNNFNGLVRGSSPSIAFIAGVAGSTVLDYQAKLDWFGTARLRAGYLFGDGAVFTYVTGGLAYGKVDVAGTTAVSGAVGPTPFSFTEAFGHSNTNTGWVVGSGTEGKLANFPGWTYRIEGLYMDLGHLDATGSGVSRPASVPIEDFIFTGSANGQVHTHTHFTDTILRLGVSYQFSGWPFH
jgi:outer membrane immunogenic protein